MFGWGREGDGYNECKLVDQTISSSVWYGVYIGFKGARFNASDATAANLADTFDIKIMSSSDSFATVGSNLSTSANWISTGIRMDRQVYGDFTIGGRSSNRSFHGKVASMVITTLKAHQTIPDDTEIRLMITDPKKWEDDYRVGQTVRNSNNQSTGTYNPYDNVLGYFGTQIWLMGDGQFDSLGNGVRSEVYPQEQNYGKLQFNNMQSNDIVNVSISGLS